MGDDSKIQWTDATWNPVTGCTKVSQGCKHCYAETLAKRMWATQYPPNADGSLRKFTDVRLHEDRLDQPVRWRRRRRIFVNSMSDLFHEAVPDAFIWQVFLNMLVAEWHTYQVLTKRPERMRAFLSNEPRWTTLSPAPRRHIWLGVSVEDQATADERIPLLLRTPAEVRFVSAEPLLERIRFSEVPDLNRIGQGPGLDWVIVGGESGEGARGFDTAWAASIVEQCQAARVACFVKQLGSRAYHTATEGKLAGAKVALKLRDRKGGNIEEWPEALRVRQWPEQQTA